MCVFTSVIRCLREMEVTGYCRSLGIRKVSAVKDGVSLFLAYSEVREKSFCKVGRKF